MIQLSLKLLATITQGVCFGDENAHFTGVAIDSRQPQKNHLFVAIRGENLDGHDFIPQAMEAGATACLVSQPIQQKIPYVLVEDTTKALGQIAKYWRDQFAIPLIALTGSNGKTTTKNMIHAILQEVYAQDANSILATKGNFNNHIGLPLTLCQLNANHRMAVIEMGMNHFHEIAYLTKLASPTTALITNAGPSHLEGVGNTIEGVAKAKGEIFEGLVDQGFAIINADDTFADYWKGLCPDQNIMTFGLANAADVFGQITPSGFVLSYRGESIEIGFPLLGQHNVMNALAASAATLVNGASLLHIKSALEKIQPAPGRMEKKVGRMGITIIDDTYNANPLSLNAALASIKEFSGQKILVLGDMRELGEQAIQLHQSSGEFAKKIGINHLYATGELSLHAVNSFGENARHFESCDQLISALENCLEPDTLILVKGSRSMKMEQVVRALLKE